MVVHVAALDFLLVSLEHLANFRIQSIFDRELFGHGMVEGFHEHRFSTENQEAAFSFLDRFNGMPARRGFEPVTVLPADRPGLARKAKPLCRFYEKEMTAFSPDPWGIRDAYIDVILDRSESAVEAFLGEPELQRRGWATQLPITQMIFEDRWGNPPVETMEGP